MHMHMRGLAIEAAGTRSIANGGDKTQKPPGAGGKACKYLMASPEEGNEEKREEREDRERPPKLKEKRIFSWALDTGIPRPRARIRSSRERGHKRRRNCGSLVASCAWQRETESHLK